MCTSDHLSSAARDTASSALMELLGFRGRTKATELVKSGLILADLRATVAGALYGDTVWRFSQAPRLSVKTAASAQTAQPAKPAKSAATAAPAVAHGLLLAEASWSRGNDSTKEEQERKDETQCSD